MLRAESIDDGVITLLNAPPNEHENIVSDLRPFLPKAETNLSLAFSADTPLGLDIATSINTWENIFKVAAATFLIAYAKKAATMAASATPDKVRQFIAAIRRSAEKLGSKLRKLPSVSIGIPFHGESVRCWLPLEDTEQSCKGFALFVSNLHGINRALDTLPHGCALVNLKIVEDSFSLSWFSFGDECASEQVFNLDGSEKTPRE